MNDIEKAWQRVCMWIGCTPEEETDTHEDFLTIKKALEEKLNGGWIPASERLPTIRECQENDCRFIVTDGNRRYQVWFDYEEGYFQKCECNGLGLKKDKCVIAWQPLPEPYKEAKRE